jgi:hypothetical protein
MIGDGTTGSGADTFYGGPDEDIIHEQVQTNDTVVEIDGAWNANHSFDVDGATAHYREGPETGSVIIYKALRRCMWETLFCMSLMKGPDFGIWVRSGGTTNARHGLVSDGSWITSAMAGGTQCI